MTVAASDPFFIYMFFMAEEDRSGVFGRECNIAATNFLSEDTYRDKDAHHDYRTEEHSFHVHQPLIRYFHNVKHYNNTTFIVQDIFFIS